MDRSNPRPALLNPLEARCRLRAMSTPPLESLDPFLARLPEDRRFTRSVRRQLYGFSSLAVVGPPEAVQALVSRLVETVPLGNVLVTAFDAREQRVGSGPNGALSWRTTEVDALQALRGFLRQDPDVVAASALPADALEMAFTVMETGHLMLFGADARDLAGFDAQCKALSRPPGTRWPQVLVLDEQGRIAAHVMREGEDWVPVPDRPLPPPKLQGAGFEVASRPPPARSEQARASWVPRTSPGALTPHRIAARSVLLPPGGWPSCAECGRPKRHVVQLSGAELPAPMRHSAHVVQLFVCENGCDLMDEAGPTCLALSPEGLVETLDPEPREGGLGGGVIDWLERPEDPHPEDGPAPTDAEDELELRPWNCDKLGGWPCWEQGPDWPEHAGERMELLFQVAEAGSFTPGIPPRWDDEASVEIPGTPRTPRLDLDRPVHLPGIFSGGDGCGWLFRSVSDPTVTRFVWQTS